MIRIATPADAAAIADIYRPYVLTCTATFEETPPDTAEMAARIEKVQSRYPYLVATEANTILGYAYASAHRERVCYRWSVDVGIYIHPDHHRRGIGRRLYKVLLPLLAKLGYHTAYALITEENVVSIHMHEKFGFTTIGQFPEVGYKFGRWLHTRCMALRLSEAEVPAKEPRIFLPSDFPA
jgi:L-amino acid N-acyltransferase YncA